MKKRYGIFTSHFDFATGLNQIALSYIDLIKNLDPEAEFIIYSYGGGTGRPGNFNQNIPYPIVNLSSLRPHEITEVLFRDGCNLIISIIDIWYTAPLFIAKRSFDFIWVAVVLTESERIQPYHYNESGKRIMYAAYLKEADYLILTGRSAVVNISTWKSKYDIELNQPNVIVDVQPTPNLINKRFQFSFKQRTEFRDTINLKRNEILTLWIGRNFVRKDPLAMLTFAKKAIQYSKFLIITSPHAPNSIDLDYILEIYDLASQCNLISSWEEIDFSDKKINILINNSVLDDDQLASVYSAADVFINTSKAEGLGLPIIEAFISGTDLIIPPYLGISNELPFSSNLHFFNCPVTPYSDPNSCGIWNSLSFNSITEHKQNIIRTTRPVEVCSLIEFYQKIAKKISSQLTKTRTDIFNNTMVPFLHKEFTKLNSFLYEVLLNNKYE